MLPAWLRIPGFRLTLSRAIQIGIVLSCLLIVFSGFHMFGISSLRLPKPLLPQPVSTESGNASTPETKLTIEPVPERIPEPTINGPLEPPGQLWRVKGENYAPDNQNSDRISATILVLVKNDELDGILYSMRQLEQSWNSKFNYPWTFFNDQPFTDDFKKRTQAMTKAPCRYELVPEEHWDTPKWIDKTRMEQGMQKLEDQGVGHAKQISYHQMCRWNSGFFYKHPALANTRYYWRVEPNVHFFCQVDYDVFRYMQDYNKTYGFTINLYDGPNTLPTLWPETMNFVSKYPEYLANNNAMKWLVDGEGRPDNNQIANGYSTCHFWSNFEIGDMEFWRSQAYEEYFTHLDKAGGFFYERWGDAPVHSIALGLFEDTSRIHWFKDIGYNHYPYWNCPQSEKCHGCNPGMFTTEKGLDKENCSPLWFKYVGEG